MNKRHLLFLLLGDQSVSCVGCVQLSEYLPGVQTFFFFSCLS